MGPAEREHHRGVCAGFSKFLEPIIAVDLQHAPERGQVSGRACIFTIVRVDVSRYRVARAAPRAIIDGVAPQPARLCPSAAGIEHRQRGVVGEHLRRGQYRAEHEVIQRCQPPAGPSDPIRQGRAIQLDALPFQHLHLPVERKGVGEFADHHVSDQRLGRHAAIDRPVGRRSHDDGIFAATTGVAQAPGHPNSQQRGHDIELLGTQLTDGVQGAPTARTVSILGIDHHLVARQMCGQRTVVAARLFSPRFTGQTE
jgi:hypothetical protein